MKRIKMATTRMFCTDSLETMKLWRQDLDRFGFDFTVNIEWDARKAKDQYSVAFLATEQEYSMLKHYIFG